MDATLVAIIAAVVKSAIVIAALLTIFAYMTLIERRVLARFQRRVGPNRAGPFGLLQPLAGSSASTWAAAAGSRSRRRGWAPTSP